jgi:hypothetical protein
MSKSTKEILFNEYHNEMKECFLNIPKWRGDENYFIEGMVLGYEIAAHKYLNIYENIVSQLEIQISILKNDDGLTEQERFETYHLVDRLL